MSRLDSAIRRLEAQRTCLDHAIAATAGLKGAVFELGLGNGRTYDHLRQHCPNREIYVFERSVSAHPDCIPDSAHLFLGDLLETLPAAAERFAGRVALLHSDIGTGDARRNAELGRFIAPYLPRLLVPGGIAVCDQAMAAEGLADLPPPEGVALGRYFLYRKEPF